MSAVNYLAVLPFLGILAGSALFNAVTPFVLGLPLLMAWLLFCVLMTSAIMWVIYKADPQNRGDEAADGVTPTAGPGR